MAWVLAEVCPANHFTGRFFYEVAGDIGNFDKALIVSSVGLSGFIVASWFRERFLFKYPQKIDGVKSVGLFSFYVKHRKLVLLSFFLLAILVAVTNFYFGIYQRGEIPKTVLPYGLSGVFKWLIIFGLASISALILRYEFELKKATSYLPVFLSLIECFLSSVSLLSRGMLINVSALGFGAYRSLKINSIKSNLRFLIIVLLLFGAMFGTSVVLVNYMRTYAYGMQISETPAVAQELEKNIDAHNSDKAFKMVIMMTTPLFVDRWVGIEAVLAILKSQKLGWDLWCSAWKEKYSDNAVSFYDNLIKSNYVNIDTSKHHFINLPGIVAFSFYPGSYLFLFISIFIVGILATLIEISAFKLGGRTLF